MKFQAGDRVRIISTPDHAPAYDGTTGSIVGVQDSRGGWRILPDGRQLGDGAWARMCWYEHELELIGAKPAVEPVTLDPSDPFDAALIPIVTTNRKKRADYAKDGDPFSNFRTSAEIFGLEGFEATDSALFNISQKIARLRALRANGRMNETQNESVTDTYLDLAVYSIILFALAKEDSE